MSKALSGMNPKKPHLLNAGGLAGEIRDLRSDVDSALENLEERDSSLNFPELDWVDGAVTAAAGDVILMGRNFLQGQTFASLTKFTGVDQLVFTALKPGLDGNALTIALVHSLGLPAVTVGKVGNAITITADLGTHTGTEIATAVNANAAATDGYLRCVGGAGTAQTAFTATPLAGGTGSGDFKVYVGGQLCLPGNDPAAGTAAITATSARMTHPTVTGAAAGDMAQITLRSDNVLAQPISAVLS